MPPFECPLCVLEKKTKWYFETPIWAIFDCETCHRPMIVLKKHCQPGSDQEGRNFEEWLEIKALKLAKEVFPEQSIVQLGSRQRVIKDHWHRHIFFAEKP